MKNLSLTTPVVKVIVFDIWEAYRVSQPEYQRKQREEITAGFALAKKLEKDLRILKLVASRRVSHTQNFAPCY